jgi:mRNA-degrading endonuclease RelE of RelBE toxin-antitoxin system
MFQRTRCSQLSKRMELRFKGQFNRDLANANRKVSEQVRDSIINVKAAKSIAQIAQLKKLRIYETHYRIKVAENYRIGIVIRNNIVWFACFGHRNKFYKTFP